jgi:hypothetical protein
MVNFPRYGSVDDDNIQQPAAAGGIFHQLKTPPKNSVTIILLTLSLSFLVLFSLKFGYVKKNEDVISFSSVIVEVIRDDNIDDFQTVTCVERMSRFGAVLQFYAGFKVEAKPVGGVLFLDRGQFGDYKTDPSYSYELTFKNVTSNYDELVTDCLENGVCSHTFDGVVDLMIDGVVAERSVACVESCVSDRSVQTIQQMIFIF